MLTTTAVIFSNTQWTFWNVFLLFFLWIPLLMIWFFALFDVFRRVDIGGGAKALWVLVIIIFPWLGTLIYLIARPSDIASTYGGYGNAYAGAGYGTPYVNPSTGAVDGGSVASSPEPKS